ncbi:hypothetical protein M8J77_000692 [Diaphorina citri]|nr:hypothetical protein M8J77_000692 [Diaphorina citri]
MGQEWCFRKRRRNIKSCCPPCTTIFKPPQPGAAHHDRRSIRCKRASGGAERTAQKRMRTNTLMRCLRGSFARDI